MGGPVQVNVYCDRSIESNAGRIARIEETVRSIYKDYCDGMVKKDPKITKGLSKFRITDIREVFHHSDLNIHYDFPVHGTVPWGLVNIAVRRMSDDAWCDVFEQNLKYTGIDFIVNETDLMKQSSCETVITDAFDLIKKRRPESGVIHCPPVLSVEDCPKISIVTPTFSARKKYIEIAFHNLLSTDYPLEKMEWVIVEDAERSEDMMSDKIINFKINTPKLSIKYIPIQGKMTIGEKRNIGVENASNDIILFMDDDDHYPTTSFRRRVAWLLKGRRGESTGADCSVCTMIALYDLKRGVSAVNVPPIRIPFAQRISEATLTFRKSFWEERKFKEISIAEGEDWISGRENQVIEIPPQQIIVAFSHGENASQRRIPPVDAQVSCFWGFPKEYLLFIHKLAGVEVVEDKKPSKK